MPEYHSLYEKKRRLGLKLEPIKKTDLKRIKKICFFDIKETDRAEKYLKDLPSERIKELINRIEEAINSREVYIVKERNKRYKWQIKEKTSKKRDLGLGYDPTYAKTGGQRIRTSSHKYIDYTGDIS